MGGGATVKCVFRLGQRNSGLYVVLRTIRRLLAAFVLSRHVLVPCVPDENWLGVQ